MVRQRYFGLFSSNETPFRKHWDKRHGALFDLHGKLAYPFAAFVVSLIGLKFGYKSEQTTGTAGGVLLAFCIGISYWFVMSAGRALGLRGGLPPFVAAWLANAVILGIIMFDAWVSRSERTGSRSIS